ncbi:immunoglobulin domain-containing protein [Nocardioides sp.]|uniref:immunoglobulin domain-containing protein n=1 Tax=Nocardioides sp. TaxID=35761 RepID=UPI0025F79F41|nr:immunoglobulin domain-containing protein [Nocardioides sp.]
MRGYAPLGRLLGLAMILAGLGTVSLATAENAAAGTADSPTAIGVSSNGTTYVGFATGGRLQRISVSGKAKGSLPLDQDEAVDGIFVTASDDIWVNYETGMSLLSPSGRVIAHHDHDPVRDCDASAPPQRYGGITARDNRIYVANRCDDSVSVYARNGDLEATVDLPGNDYPRGITYGVAQAGRPAMLYVAVPDRGQVFAYKAASLRSSAKPAQTFTMRRPGGGKRPMPAGIAVDKWGQLTVTDIANNAVYLVDTNHGFSLYRTLGHPPRASRAAGRLSSPGALAQHAQDGGSLSGDLFIADTGNGRAQRWNTSGYTYWAKNVRPGSGGGGGDDGGDGGGDGGDGDGGGNGGGDGGGGGVPVSTSPPTIGGSAQVGSTLSCSSGGWFGSPGSIERAWLRNGGVIGGATGSTYVVTATDAGTTIGCRVRAGNASGTSDWVYSDTVTVSASGGGSGPTNISPPVISGTAAVGQTLTCSAGSWSGGGGPFGGTANTYAYQWRRDGGAISGATGTTYAVVAADAGTSLTCVVTATNTSGSSQQASAPVVVGGGTAGPVNVSAPAVLGTPAVGQALTCSPGSWTGTAITYAFQWRRDGAVLTGATAATYAVLAADAGHALSCTVTATTTGGSSQQTSAPVVVGGGTAGPVNVAAPVVSGTPAVGQTLTCGPGSWTGATAYAFAWRRDGALIGGATAATYQVGAADAGRALTCVVTASNLSGSAQQSSAAVTVAAEAPANPVNTVPPIVSGSAAPGEVLTCLPGAWSGSGLGYTYSWKRNGTAIALATWSSYTVLSEDVGASLTCTVVATNTQGSAQATSSPAVVPGPSGHAPANTAAPAVTGTAAAGQTLTCEPGTWAGIPELVTTYRWQRNGADVAGATGATYVVAAADAATSLRCVVVVANGYGKAAVASPGVTVAGSADTSACLGQIGVSVDAGATRVTTPDVLLGIVAPSGVTTVTISNDFEFATSVTMPVTPSCTYAWTLRSTPGAAAMSSVFVRFGSNPMVFGYSVLVDRTGG